MPMLSRADQNSLRAVIPIVRGWHLFQEAMRGRPKAALFELVSGLVPQRGQGGLAAGGGEFERAEDLQQVLGVRLRADEPADFLKVFMGLPRSDPELCFRSEKLTKV